MKIFSGTANPKLSEEVATLLNLPISKSEIVRFGNSEVRVRIEEDVKDEVCYVIQPTSNPTDAHLMELFFFADALKRSDAKKIIAVIPYFGYARQNIQHRVGECVSANVVIHFLENIGFHEIITFDLHDEATEGIFTVPFSNLTSFSVLANSIVDYLGKESINTKDIMVVSPDQGGVERARRFGAHLFGTDDFPITVIEKNRDQNAIHQSTAVAIYGDVKNKIVILLDDILTSGGTMFNAADLCIKKGAKRVIGAIVHHDFAPDAVKNIEKSVLEKLFTTNTIELKKEQMNSKIVESSIADLIASLLR